MIKKIISSFLFILTFCFTPLFSQTFTERQTNGSILTYSNPVTFTGISNELEGAAFYTAGTPDAHGITTFDNNATFTGNSTTGKGGAMYINSYADVVFNGTGNTIFQNNQDSTGANDIYMANNSTLTTASSGTYTFKSGIAGMAGASIIHSGSGLFDAVMKSYLGKFTQNGNGSSIIRGDTSAAYTIENGAINFTDSILTGGSLQNNAEATFSGSGVTIGADITGTGTTLITGKVTNNAVITQSDLKIANGGDFTTDLSAININGTDLSNNGSLRVTNDNLTYNITNNGQTGQGSLYILGTIDNTGSNNKTINQKALIIEEGGSFTTSLDGLNGIENSYIYNQGDLIINDAIATVFNKEISNAGDASLGNLYLNANITNSGSTGKTITQNNIYLGKFNTFSSDLSLLNISGAIYSGSVLTLNGGGTLMSILNLNESSHGYLYLTSGDFTNLYAKAIKQADLRINHDASLKTDATALTIDNAIQNQGTLDFVSGINSNAITNTGTLIFSGSDVTNNGAINSTGTLTISGKLTNNSTISNTITATTITGTLINNNTDAGALNLKNITIELSGNLTTNAGSVSTNNPINNLGQLTFSGGTNTNQVTGTGTLGVSGQVINNALIQQAALNVMDTGDFSTDMSLINITTMANDGILRLSGSGALTNDITFTSARGNLYINSNINNNDGKTIAQKTLNIADTGSFSTDTAFLDLTEGINNEGNLSITGSNNTNAITNNGELTFDSAMANSGIIQGSGIMTINDTFATTVLIKQDILKISSTGSLTTDVNNLEMALKITNDNLLTLTENGIIKSTIDGIGNLKIDGNISQVANKGIKQTGLTILTGRTFTAQRDYLDIGSDGIKAYGNFNLAATSDGSMLSAGDMHLFSAVSGTPTFSMQNDFADRLSFNNIETESNTDLKMDIFNNENGISNDSITATDAVMNGGLSVVAGVGTYTNANFNLINTNGSLSGKLIDQILAGNPLLASLDDKGQGLTWEFIVKDNTVRIIINGVVSSMFASLQGLSYNQLQIARELDYLSGTAQGDIENVINGINSSDESAQKAALEQISPSFLANILAPKNNGAQRLALSHHIREHCDTTPCDSPGIWVEGDMGSETISSDEDIFKDIKAKSGSTFFGADKYFSDYGIMTGFYGSYTKTDITQEDNKADISSYGLGFYGGYIDEATEIKLLLGASYDSYDTNRKINLNQPLLSHTATAKFNGVTVRADLEAAQKYKLTDTFMFRPFIGADVVMLNYDDFEETGADSLNMNIKGANNLAVNIRIGGGLKAELGPLSLNADAEYAYLVQGKDADLTGRLNTPDSRDFITKSEETGPHIVGISGGANFKISGNFSLFANASYRTAKNYTDARGNFGIRYSFCSTCRNYKYLEEDYNQTYTNTQALTLASVPEAEKESNQKNREGATTLILPDSLFNAHDFNITPELNAYLKTQSDAIKEAGYNEISITGHSDNTGTAEENEMFSTMRALIVAETLVKNGIDSSKISAEGKSSKVRVGDNNTEAGRAGNRRVEIVVK